MKNTSTLFLIIALAVAVLTAGCGKSSGLKDTPPEVKLYGVKSAMIEYAYTGDAVGKKVQYIANYGMYQAEEDNFTLKMGGAERKINTITLRNDSVQYVIDVEKKTGTKTPIQLNDLKQMTSDFTAQQKENVNVELIKRMGGTKTGNESILGKNCEVFDLMGNMKIWMWNGLVLKSEMNMGASKMVLTATKLETDISVDAEKFSPAADIKIEEHTMGLPPGHPQVDPNAQAAPRSGSEQANPHEGAMPQDNAHPGVKK